MKKLVYTFVVIFCFIAVIKTCQRNMEIASWPEAEAVIESHRIDSYRESETYLTGDGTSRSRWVDRFKVDFNYRFNVENVSYQGRFILKDMATEGVAKRKASLYPDGKTITIKYDPLNPDDNVFRD
ncbi:DUF3592 domain-containing protein [Aestuariirhabdus sp. Z084]|uniref:DUF3592 domain-containing protein n=1 Tax=Aestuariirhabdus haliotis TaxID=2918751 RepID=UPI00201B36D3|nr:DUF3592 domain-containing protein [Aestuariirhabdus haliotis]MCL6417663.1 DUF3592 domain-containing protein [Aestuariirhabdus haliotis]MCL6421575.1 DUF3592 domain-containing protein [Aestuariirhabdus haliotis]